MLLDPSGHRRVPDGYRSGSARSSAQNRRNRSAPPGSRRTARSHCCRLRSPQNRRLDPLRNLPPLPPAAELEAIRLLIHLCREYRCRIHIVHLSTDTALPALAAARAEGLSLTVETCPHYLFFAADSIPDRATQFKCAPPIRDSANREALWQALRAGTIDLIATDHSPCPPTLKCLDTGSFQSAWGGISSLSLALSIVWTEAGKRGFTLSDVVRWMSEAPAALAGISHRKGRIAPGFNADLVIFDPGAEFEVTPERLHFRHPCTPYLGQRLRGEVRSTLLRG